jgi:hypothetical protein
MMNRTKKQNLAWLIGLAWAARDDSMRMYWREFIACCSLGERLFSRDL